MFAGQKLGLAYTRFGAADDSGADVLFDVCTQ